MEPKRILFVDDEPGIRLTLPPILQAHGFELTPAAGVVEALELIQKEKFDVLLTDLNIGHPGDGFTLVSAMRRIQPEAVTIIITGYPAFESALRAIREQVDDYVVKPAEIADLISVIQQKLSHRAPRHVFVVKRVCEIVEEHAPSIIADWLKRTKQNPELAAASLSDKERSDHVPALLEILVRELRDATIATTPEFVQSAAQHGIARRRQGASIPMVIEETRILRDAIAFCIQQNLLAVDISSLIPDMVQINNILDAQIRESVRAYTQAGPDSARGGRRKTGRRVPGGGADKGHCCVAYGTAEAVPLRKQPVALAPSRRCSRHLPLEERDKNPDPSAPVSRPGESEREPSVAQDDSVIQRPDAPGFACRGLPNRGERRCCRKRWVPFFPHGG